MAKKYFRANIKSVHSLAMKNEPTYKILNKYYTEIILKLVYIKSYRCFTSMSRIPAQKLSTR